MNIKVLVKNIFPAQTGVILILIFILIGVIIYFLNFFTPLNWDDYNYKFISEVNDESHPLRLISNVPDILYSQYNHYFSTNGRSLCHFFVQLFSGLIGKNIFNFINTLVFILFIILISAYINKFKPLNIFFIFSLIILLFPAFNETILWMTGSINYLWTCTGIIFFLVLFQNLKSQLNKSFFPFLFLIGLIIGWSNEGISLPFAGGLIVFMIFNRFSINPVKLFLIIGFIVGSFICSFSPSTISRSEVTQNSILYLLIHKGEAFFIVLSKLRAIYILLVFFVFKYIQEFRERPDLLLKFCKENIILIISWFFSFFIIFLAGQTDTRSAVGVEFFSILLILKLFPFKVRIYNIIVQQIFCFITISFLPFIFYYSYNNYKIFKSVEYQLAKTNNEVILYDDIHIPNIFRQYILVPRSYNFISHKMGNDALNKFYKQNNPIFLPNNIYKDIEENNKSIKNILSQKNYKFYVLAIKIKDWGKTPYFKLKIMQNKDIPIIFRPFKNKLDRYSALEIPAQDYQTVNINGKYYLLIGRNEMIDKRVNSIILK